MTAKKFYEEMYGVQGRTAQKAPLLYRMLKRFELNRYDLGSQLAPGGDSLLDIACGDGDLMIRVKSKYREVWGVDIAQPRIDRIREKVGTESGIHVRVEDANEKLAFKDGSFDTVTALSIFEHIFDPYHLIEECYRLLKNGGTLIVQVPNTAWLPNRIRLFTGRLPETAADAPGWDGGHLHYFTRSSFKKLLVDQGFDIVKVTNGGIFARFRRIWGSLLGADIFIVGVKTS